MCHNLLAAAAHRPRMDGPNRTACRPPVSIGEESLARDSELSVESQIVEQPAIQGLSLVVRSTCASVTRRAATNSARANEGLLLSLCCVLKKKLEKRGGNIYSSDNE